MLKSVHNFEVDLKYFVDNFVIELNDHFLKVKS